MPNQNPGPVGPTTTVAQPGTVIPVGSLITPGGDQGPPGVQGTPGIGIANSTTMGAFTVPAVGISVTVDLADVSWIALGMMVYVAQAGGPGQSGALQVTGITGKTLTLTNPVPAPAIPAASPTQPGLLNQLTGASTDFVGGDNACHNLNAAVAALAFGCYYGTDTTNSLAYAVTVQSNFKLSPGVVVWVTPTNTNSGANPTLNVNGTGVFPLVTKSGYALAYAGILPPIKTFGVVYDGANWRIFTPLALSVYLVNPVNVNIECGGYDSANISIVMNGNPCGVTLLHLATGVPLTFRISNTYTSALNWWLNCTKPDGSNYSGTYWCWSNSLTVLGTYTRIDSTNPQGAPTGLQMMMTGSAEASGSVFLL